MQRAFTRPLSARSRVSYLRVQTYDITFLYGIDIFPAICHRENLLEQRKYQFVGF